MASNTSSSSSSQVVSTLTAMGLFVVTAAVSQWVQNQQDDQPQPRPSRRSRRRRRYAKSRGEAFRRTTSHSDDSSSSSGLEDQRAAFQRRQLSRRLSFHQTTTDDDDDDDDDDTDDCKNEKINEAEDLPLRVRGNESHSSSTTTTTTTTSTRFMASVISDRYHDFHPKYQNWRHFEHCNEHDRRKRRSPKQEAGERAGESKPSGLQIGSVVQGRPFRRNRTRRTSTSSGSSSSSSKNHGSVSTFDNDDDNNYEGDDDREDPGNQFVWTGGHASQYHRRASSKSECHIPADESRFDDGSSSLLSVRKTKEPPSNNSSDNGIPSPTTKEKDPNKSSTNPKIVNNNHHKDRLSKFGRFYRMLTSSIIEDEQTQSNSNNNLRISTSSSGSSSNSNIANYETAMDDDDSSSSSSSHDFHRAALRTEYNARIMPEKLILIRHGQSLGNVDETVYATTPDNAMPITDLGWEQARAAGKILKTKLLPPNESVHFMVSPYVRTVETFHGIVSAWCDPEEFADIEDPNRRVNAWYERLTLLGLTWNEDPRLREQDFGNYQNPEVTRRAKEERHRFGAFYYRFNNGESGSDVFDRVSTFLDSLWRSFETNNAQNYVLVTHGIVLRVLMARYFRYTITQLNMLANPKNCEMVVLGHAGFGRLDLEGRCALEIETDADDGTKHVSGYKFHKRLRILPKSHIQTVRFRISASDASTTTNNNNNNSSESATATTAATTQPASAQQQQPEQHTTNNKTTVAVDHKSCNEPPLELQV